MAKKTTIKKIKAPRPRPSGGAGGAPRGNKNGLAVKGAEARQLAYQSYCDHLATGGHKDAWFYNDGAGNHCCKDTMEAYLLDRVEFDPSKKLEAEARGFAVWYDVIGESARGNNTRANTATLQMLMRNKYGWDRVDRNQNDVSVETVKKFDALMDALSRLQNDRK